MGPVGSEPWGVAVFLGSIFLYVGLAYVWWALRFTRPDRDAGEPNAAGVCRYFLLRASVYLLLGGSLIVGHWLPNIGMALMLLAFALLLTLAFRPVRRRIVGTTTAPSRRRHS
jgi:hypothetical protein